MEWNMVVTARDGMTHCDVVWPTRWMNIRLLLSNSILSVVSYAIRVKVMFLWHTVNSLWNGNGMEWNGMEMWNGTVRRVQGSTTVARINVTARIAW